MDKQRALTSMPLLLPSGPIPCVPPATGALVVPHEAAPPRPPCMHDFMLDAIHVLSLQLSQWLMLLLVYIKPQSVRKSTITSYLEEFQRSVEKKTGLLAREVNDLRRDDSASNAVVTSGN
ncbi:hypothetical protein CC79DRAFT_1056372 [Sarocladium strictum]